MKTIKTKAGTEIPLLDLRGKDYLEVKWRIFWFREERPEWSIETDFTIMQPDHAMARAIIRDQNNRIISVAHKREDKQHFPDFAEKAETGAIGRALANCGYGTQFAPDIEEGERIVDAPVQSKPSRMGARGDINPKAMKRVTEGQLTRLYAITNESGIPLEEIKLLLKGFGVESSKDLTMEQYDRLIEAIQKAKKKPVE